MENIWQNSCHQNTIPNQNLYEFQMTTTNKILYHQKHHIYELSINIAQTLLILLFRLIKYVHKRYWKSEIIVSLQVQIQ